jgi:hypothetical protein
MIQFVGACEGSGSLVVGHFGPPHYVCATAQGQKPNVTYFATKNTSRAFDLYELRAAI